MTDKLAEIFGWGTPIAPDPRVSAVDALDGMALERDEFPGVSDEDMFRGPDPDLPATPDPSEDVISLLRAIRDRLPAPTDAWFQEVLYPLLGEAGMADIQTRTPYRNLYLTLNPGATAEVDVWAGGGGRTLRLGRVTATHGLRAELPYVVRGIHIEWSSAAAGDTLDIIESSGKIDVARVEQS